MTGHCMSISSAAYRFFRKHIWKSSSAAESKQSKDPPRSERRGTDTHKNCKPAQPASPKIIHTVPTTDPPNLTILADGPSLRSGSGVARETRLSICAPGVCASNPFTEAITDKCSEDRATNVNNIHEGGRTTRDFSIKNNPTVVLPKATRNARGFTKRRRYAGYGGEQEGSPTNNIKKVIRK
ncbi:hypothetical protein RUND412_005884 [Rhizina undulata]